MTDVNTHSDTVEWQGVTYKTILRSEDSGGAMSIVDSTSPVDSSPPRHVHHDADETFVLLTGACEFCLDGEMSIVRAGEAVFVPRGHEHTFRAIGDEPCRHLVILTPGGFEGFFRAMAAGQYRIPEDMAPVQAFAEQYNLSLTGAPLGAM